MTPPHWLTTVGGRTGRRLAATPPVDTSAVSGALVGVSFLGGLGGAIGHLHDLPRQTSRWNGLTGRERR